jgi:8-amino-7-oxononanoate synthase
MLDFTSALYLAIHHPSRSLRVWPQLTTGKPAALEVPPGTGVVAEALAELQGCECVTLLPSTLHLFFDLFEVLRGEGVRLFVDAGVYPMARWGAERAAARGAPMHQVPHYDPLAAARMIESDQRTDLRPVIVADGFCPACGRAAPLRRYLTCVVPRGGYVVLDDTQALGIWGHDASRSNPFGRGGGGSLRLHGLRSPAVIVGSSLAKAFGVPVAALSGSANVVRRFERTSETRMHASPPSAAVLSAAARALQINRERGDAIRRHLAELVLHFRNAMRAGGIGVAGGRFPVQALAIGQAAEPVRLHKALLAAAIRTVLARTRTRPGARVLFILNASHTIEDLDRAVSEVFAALRRATREPLRPVHASRRSHPDCETSP